MANIKQICNSKNKNGEFHIEHPKEIEIKNSQEKDNYFETVISGIVYKFGYCCEPKGIEYPIYIKQSNESIYKEFFIGNQQMYEAQIEQWIDVNDKTMKNQEDANPQYISFLLPKDIEFTFDFVM